MGDNNRGLLVFFLAFFILIFGMASYFYFRKASTADRVLVSEKAPSLAELTQMANTEAQKNMDLQKEQENNATTNNPTDSTDNIPENVDPAAKEQLLKEQAEKEALLAKEQADKAAKEQAELTLLLANPQIAKDPLYFNLVADIPEAFNTDTVMDQAIFKSVISNPNNRKTFCNYAVRSLKIYKVTNNENRSYTKYKVRNLTSVEECIKPSILSSYDIYQLYMAIYEDYIRTSPTLPKDIIVNINKAKKVRIKSYFNVVEDFPNFLSRTTPLTVESFKVNLAKPYNLSMYCAYYANFILVFNTFNNNALSPISKEDCIKNFNADTQYNDYSAFYQYLNPKKYNLTPDLQARMIEISNYKLLLSKD